MAEEVLFEAESTRSRSDVAAYLRTVADRLEDGDALSLNAGDQSVTLDPPETVEFEVKAERENGERSVEFEVEWDEDSADETSGDLTIE
ncbi:amphi-Trp domain-containing protein [Halomicrobium salinisoli]|uniref:amphi-Trp domain-containing protein n=1 Tax=Halomicrobium salinisoli TaxID=2878391 RepID=UPI001CF0C8F4|nr:amphi-Trp domain-containing protein [Halomicrobium salinisoli]